MTAKICTTAALVRVCRGDEGDAAWLDRLATVLSTLPEVEVVRDAAPRVACVVAPLAARDRMMALADSASLLVIVPSTTPPDARLDLLAAGADDVLDAQGPTSIADAVARIRRWLAVRRVVESELVRENLVGTSTPWRALVRRVVEIAHFTSASVLLDGESGTGKELVARLIHTLDARPDKGELVVLDCTTIVPSLSGSEFFGHERGAFTGASATRDGAFALAHGGTLFLDEIADLPLPLQAQLLRAIQEHTYKRVGSNTWQRTEFRLVCASHRNLADCVAKGEFRHDLYHRIATWTVHLPPLRDRPDDVLPLARHFAAQLCEREPPAFDDAVARYLECREYPGNVRELRHTVARLLDRYPGSGPISAGQIPPDERELAPHTAGSTDDGLEASVQRALASGLGLRALRKRTEDIAVRVALAREHGNVPRASRSLGVTERALQLREAERRRHVGRAK